MDWTHYWPSFLFVGHLDERRASRRTEFRIRGIGNQPGQTNWLVGFVLSFLSSSYGAELLLGGFESPRWARMRLFHDWFRLHAAKGGVEEVNFWRPFPLGLASRPFGRGEHRLWCRAAICVTTNKKRVIPRACHAPATRSTSRSTSNRQKDNAYAFFHRPVTLLREYFSTA